MNRGSTDGQRSLYESELIAESRLSREYCEIDVLLLVDQTIEVLAVVFLSSLHILLGLLSVAHKLIHLASDEPELAGILLWDGLEHVVEDIECLLEVLLAEQANNCIVGVLMNVQRAQSNIRKICLTASVTRIIPIWTKIFVVGELLSWIQNLVRMHNLRTLIKVANSFVVFTRVDLHDSSIQVVIFFVEDVLLVIVGLLSFFGVGFVITLISSL